MTYPAKLFVFFSIVFTALFLGIPAIAQPSEPSLPPGLGESNSSPDLPSGLSQKEKSEGPSLPPGLGTETENKEGKEKKETNKKRGFIEKIPFQLGGFWEFRGGFRTGDDPYEKDTSIAETRLQLEIQRYWRSSSFEFTGDFIYDAVLDEDDVDLEEGSGFFDLRELKYTFTPIDFMDVRVGRQILTWGTGDLLFLNDLFPKDWRSFFIGRDVDYLKAPSDAVKFSIFGRSLGLPLSLDLVYTPRFDPDRFIDGRRISYWNPLLGRRAGRDNTLETATPDDWFTDDELALRLYRNFSGNELALYFYDGFWKSPAGMNPSTGQFIHPELMVYGASVEGNVGAGIGNIEFAYYNSEEDRKGDDPNVDNSQLRFLIGYEQEAARNFTVAGQYYLEYMLDYDAYRDNLPAGQPKKDEDRHVLTIRLTKQLLMQNLELSLFAFYSPSDNDAYLRPRISYDINDQWQIEGGGNIFLGDKKYTFFGQFEENTNIYAGLRYSF